MTALIAQEPCVVPVMVGTAGHVDHGKTALVGLLTGCNTDTLPEEKTRGMSIDLGFAPFIMDDSRMVGIIDVPGHEDFIRNMVAGASSIDVLMLVIAADDGIMPQTIEHLKIVSLLKTPKVMAVLTKIDLVSVERRQEVKEAVAGLLRDHGFSGAPIILESNTTGEGIDEVRDSINRLVNDVKRMPRERTFRMDIERVFSIQGYGTVVAGIPSSGKCAIGDELELFPGPEKTACRAIQKYSKQSENTEASVCSAINIRTIKADDIKRGMTIAAPGAYRQSSSAMLSIRNVHESMPIKRRQEMRFCYGTSAGIISGLLVGSDSLAPGDEGFMQIKMREPVVIAAGDRFILRALSPSATVAGGVVLTVNCDQRNRKQPGAIEKLKAAREAVEHGDPFLSELMAGSPCIINQRDVPFLIQSVGARAKKEIDEKESNGTITPLGTGYWLVKARLSELEARIKSLLAIYHKENKVSRGMPLGQLCGLLGLDAACSEGLKTIFLNNNTVMINTEYASLKDFKPALSAKQQGLRDNIIKEVSASGSAMIALTVLQAKLGAVSADMQLVIRILSEEGVIAVLSDHIVSTAVISDCLNKLLKLFEKEDIVDLKCFRDATGLSRNMAVPILERFDSMGITRRDGNGRKLLRKQNDSPKNRV